MPSTISNLAVGLASFTQYDFTCGRGYAFSESYLAKPASEILTACYPGHIVFTEVKHPTLEATGRGGRPRVDLAVLRPIAGKSRENGSPIVYLELKWCGPGKVGAAAVLWDIYRLAAIQYHHPGVETFFALVGLRTRVERFLASIGETRILKGQQRSYLRSSSQGSFPDLKFRQLTPELKSRISIRLGQYKPGAIDHVVGIKQMEVARHDAAPHEWRPNMKPRLGFTAIVVKIATAKHAV